MKFIVSAVTILVCFSLSELFLRMSYDVRKMDQRFYLYVKQLDGEDWSVNEPYFIEDPVLFWKSIPNSRDLNEFGFRGETPLKKSNRLRIANLGDSVTIGFDVGLKSTYPYLLNNKKIESLNFGVEAYSSYQGMKLLEKEVLKFHPDIVTVSFFKNDENLSCLTDRYVSELYQKLYQPDNFIGHSYLYRMAVKSYINVGYFINRRWGDQYKCSENSYRVSPDEYEKNLKSIHAIASASGARVIYVAHPINKFQYKKMSLYSEYLARMEKVAKATGSQLVKVREFGEEVTPEEAQKYFLDTCHLTEQGHALMAAKIHETVLNGKSR